jgi:hypothetical protein
MKKTELERGGSPVGAARRAGDTASLPEGVQS